MGKKVIKNELCLIFMLIIQGFIKILAQSVEECAVNSTDVDFYR